MLIKQGKTNIKYLLIVVILAAIVGGGILGYCWKAKQEVKMPEVKVPEAKELEGVELNYKNILEQMFPKGEFIEIKANQCFKDEVKYPDFWEYFGYRIYCVEETLEGSFIKPGERNLLLIFDYDTSTGWPHAAGLDHKYLAIFNIKGERLLVEPTEFFSDKVDFALYNCKEIAYILYTSERGTTGGLSGDVALFQIKDGEFEKIWDRFELAKELDVDPYLEVIFAEPKEDRLVIYKDETFVHWYDLYWNETTCRFEKDETADWQTYKNEEYGFEIKYPYQWGDICDEKEFEELYDKGIKCYVVQQEPRPDWKEMSLMITFQPPGFGEMTSQRGFIPMTMEIKENPQKLNLVDFYFSLLQHPEEYQTKEDFKEDLIIATHRVGDISYYELTMPESTYGGTVFPLDSAFLEFGYKGFNLKDEETFNQILSTFRFLEEERIKCISDEDCIIFGDESNANCGCFNKDSQWQPIEVKVGESLRSVPIHCRCINGACGPVFKPTGESSEFDFVYIKKIYTKNEKEYLDIDYIEWVTCDGIRSECLAPNAYVIMNYEPEIKTFEIYNDVDIRMCSPSHYVIWDEKITYERFKELLEEQSYYIGGIPFHIKVQNDKIIKIEEQYIP